MILSHIHTTYSDGLLCPDQLDEFEVVLIADHLNVYESVRRHLTDFRRYPFIGAEIYLMTPENDKLRHLTVYAYTPTGVTNLFEILANPPTLDQLMRMSLEGLIIGSGCVASPFHRMLRENPEAFFEISRSFLERGAKFAFEVFPFDPPGLIDHLLELEIPVLVSSDCHVLPDDFELYQLMLSMRPDESRHPLHPLKGGKGFAGKMAETREYITRLPGRELAQINRWLEPLFPSQPLISFCLPRFPDEEFESLKSRLMGMEMSPKERHQLEYELSVIETVKVGENRLRDYFVLLDRVFRSLRDIPYSIRGSGAGSMVVYLLSSRRFPNPLRNGCFFERFINPYRISMPDVDIDVPDQEEAIRRLSENFRIIRLCAYARYDDVDSLLREYAVRLMGKNVRVEDVDEELLNFFRKQKVDNPDARIQKLRQQLDTLRQKHEVVLRISQHAGGFVLVPRGIPMPIPVFPESIFGTSLSMLDMDLIPWKLDVLQVDALRHLPVVNSFEFPQAIPTAPLRFGSAGVFQLNGYLSAPVLVELAYQREYLTPEDLIVMVAGIRPGSSIELALKRLGIGMTGLIERFYKNSTNPHASFLFQEEVMREVIRIARSLSVSEEKAYILADMARKAQAKGDREMWLRVRQELQALGARKEDLERLENSMGYGFNRAHAVVYAFHAARSILALHDDPLGYLLRVARQERKDRNHASLAQTVFSLLIHAIARGMGVEIRSGESQIRGDWLTIGSDVLGEDIFRATGLFGLMVSDVSLLGFPLLDMIRVSLLLGEPKQQPAIVGILGEVRDGSRFEKFIITPYGLIPQYLAGYERIRKTGRAVVAFTRSGVHVYPLDSPKIIEDQRYKKNKDKIRLPEGWRWDTSS